MVTLSSGIKCC